MFGLITADAGLLCSGMGRKFASDAAVYKYFAGSYAFKICTYLFGIVAEEIS